jgi:hypothetical protein
MPVAFNGDADGRRQDSIRASKRLDALYAQEQSYVGDTAGRKDLASASANEAAKIKTNACST